MTYILQDEESYLGDVASIHGWAEFVAWVDGQTQADAVLKAFVRDGYTEKPKALAVALASLSSSDPAVDETRKLLLDAGTKAAGSLILWDGIEDQTDPTDEELV